MKLDKRDKLILNTLQENAKITNAGLSKIAGISAPATLERVKRLEKAGVITNVSARIDPEKLGFGILAMVNISLTLSRMASVEEIKAELAGLDEVVECYQIAGAHDFILKVLARDIKTYGEFINMRLTCIRGVQVIQSSFVIDRVKENQALLLHQDQEYGV